MTIISFEKAARRLRATGALGTPALDTTPDDWTNALRRMRLLAVFPNTGAADIPPEFQDCVDEMARINDAIGAMPMFIGKTNAH